LPSIFLVRRPAPRFSLCLQRKSNKNQLCWLVHKVCLSESAKNAGYKSFQQFLDSCQYSKHSIRSYELIFGKDFCCPGGLQSTEVRTNIFPARGGLDRLATWHRWAGWSGVQVGRHVKCLNSSNDLYPVNRGRVGREGREESERQPDRGGEGRREWNGGECPGASSWEGRAVLKYMCRGPPVPGYAAADGAGLSTYLGQV